MSVSGRTIRPRPEGPAAVATVMAATVVVFASLLVPLAAPASAAAYDTAWALDGAAVHRSSPTLGDLSVGRVVLSADMDGWLRAVRADGTVAWRSPVDPQPGIRTAVESSPAVGDLDGDGRNDVVVGAGSDDPNDWKLAGGVVAYRGDGSVLWRWRSPDRFGPNQRPDGVPDVIFSSPAIGDVDGDGRNDVVFGGWDANIWALRGSDGTVIPGFPFENTDSVFSSPALYDIDSDGSYEIIIGGDQTANPAMPGTYNGGVLRALKARAGRVEQRWRVNVPDIVGSSPAIGDINGDGRMEAVFASGGYWNPPDNRRVWAVHLDNGSMVPGWPQTTDAMVFGSPALGDVTPGDTGRPEVVVGDIRGNLYAWRGNGSRVWKTSPGPDNDTFFGGPSIADLDGDGDQDVAIGYGFGGALLVRGTDGQLMRQVVAGPFASEGTPLVADFGGSVGRRLVVSGFNPAIGDWQSGQLAAFTLPSTSAPADWPMFRKVARHLGGPESVVWLKGHILDRYNSLGGARGFLGKPLTPELATPYRFGRYNHFQGGSIYWSPASGAWEVHGAIRQKWAAMGWENGFLGFPTTNEQPLRGGAFSRFQGGQLYWSPATGPQSVHGAIFGRWGTVGYEKGRLGYPTTDERATPHRFGRYNHFQGGSVYWSPATGAHPVWGGIREVWSRAGWENGCLGFPISGERQLAAGNGSTYVRQDFERGIVTWTPQAGARIQCG